MSARMIFWTRKLLLKVKKRHGRKAEQHRERMKEIFQKYGFTVTSILWAAVITIVVVVGMVTNAFKATRIALGAGL